MSFFKFWQYFRKPPSIFQILGKEKGIKQLVETFYQHMQDNPMMIHVYKVHGEKITPEMKEKLHAFICGWTGGPNLYVEKYGAPRMRMRHMPFVIGEKERDQWLQCIEFALRAQSQKISPKNLTLLLNSFTALALRIQNH
jgi:hemoglobin